MINKTEIGQKIGITLENGNTIIGKIIKAYGQENPYNPGQFAKINMSTPHGTILYSGVFHCKDLTDEELKELEEHEEDAKNMNQLYDYNESDNIEHL
jgi:hypothetical protein